MDDFTKEEALEEMGAGTFHCDDCGLFNGQWYECSLCVSCQWKWHYVEECLAEEEKAVQDRIDDFLNG